MYKIGLGVSGGIAAYKAVEVMRLLQMLVAVISRYQIPTKSCVLTHVTNTLQAMDKGLVDYLSGAIKGGKAKGADLLWYGEFRDFPYDNGKGVFQVAVPLEQATYEFFPGWQPLTELQIDLLFQNAGLDMRSSATRLGKARSDAVHAWIPDLSPGAHLYVDARVQGEGQAISGYLQDSPLAGSVGQALREIEIRGPMEGTVKLDIPLGGKGEVKASGEANFHDNSVRIATLDLPLEKVQGRLEYDNEHTHLSNLKASLWNQPLTLDYRGKQLPHGYQADLKFKGLWDSSRQRQDIPALEMLKGRSNWTGTLGLTLPENKAFSFQLALDSNLQGMGLDLPVPLTKAPESRLPLKVTARGRDGSADIRAVLGADVDMQSRLVYGEGAPYLSRVRVNVGQPGARVLQDKPMLLAINQQQADVAGGDEAELLDACRGQLDQLLSQYAYPSVAVLSLCDEQGHSSEPRASLRRR